MLRALIFVILIVLPILVRSQTSSSAANISAQLDSLVKTYNINMISIYAYKNYNDNINEQILVTSSAFRFNGQFVILSDYEKSPRYFNLDKLVSFTIARKNKTIQMFFQVQ